MTQDATVDSESDAEDDPTTDDDPDPEAVRRAIRRRAKEIKRRELRRAVDRLEANGSLDDDQRRIVEAMATAIVDDIVAAPEAALADPAVDAETLRTAIELFDPTD